MSTAMSTGNQKVAVITGASQGIGAALVEGYHKLGYAVVATSRTIAPADDADVLTVRGDVADPATAERVVAAAVERFGRIDTLVNNAGVFVAKPFDGHCHGRGRRPNSSWRC
ncbi:(S)-1-Phenylethanol dehydrogenase [Streptomyces alboniger]